MLVGGQDAFKSLGWEVFVIEWVEAGIGQSFGLTG